MQRSSVDTLRGKREQNLAKNERYLSVAAGVMLMAGAVHRSAWPRLALGLYLVYRGAVGRCPLYAALGVRHDAARRPDLERRFGEGQRDVVEEASWQSFPASDPPGNY